MFTGIISKILAVGLAAALLGSGILYVQNLQLKNDVQTAEGRAQVAESNLKTSEKIIAIFKEYNDVEAIIENNPDDDVAYYLQHGVWRDSDTKGNRIPTTPGTAGSTKPGKRQ